MWQCTVLVSSVSSAPRGCGRVRAVGHCPCPTYTYTRSVLVSIIKSPHCHPLAVDTGSTVDMSVLPQDSVTVTSRSHRSHAGQRRRMPIQTAKISGWSRQGKVGSDGKREATRARVSAECCMNMGQGTCSQCYTVACELLASPTLVAAPPHSQWVVQTSARG